MMTFWMVSAVAAFFGVVALIIRRAEVDDRKRKVRR